MHNALFKHEAGWVSAVNSTILVIGEGNGAEEAVKALQPLLVYWIGVDSWALAEHVIPFPKTRVHAVHGQRGHFRVKIQGLGETQWLECGSIVLAPCPNSEIPENLGLPKSRLIYPTAHAQRIPAMGQKVGFYLGKEESGGYFTLVALREAIRFAEMGSQINFFFYDLPLAAEGFEALYQQSLQLGIRFLRLRQPLKVVEVGDALRLDYQDPMLPQLEVIEFTEDILFAGEQFRPSPEFARLAELIQIETDSEGFLQAENVRYFPIYTNRPGVYVLGASKGGSFATQASLEARAIAGELAPFLTGEILISDGFARVNSEKCSLCLACYRICKQRAIEIDFEKNSVYIEPLACRGCGVCAAECSTRAITLPRTARDLNQRSNKEIYIYACENSGYLALRSMAIPPEWKDRLQIIAVPCTGDVEELAILKALADGVRQVVLVGCHEENCLCAGNKHAQRRIHEIQRKLEAIGLNSEKVQWIATAPNAGLKCQMDLKKVLELSADEPQEEVGGTNGHS